MKLKRILMLLVAIVVTFNISLITKAATWNDVDSWDELENAFIEDTDEEVIINLTGDIECMQRLTTNVGQKYTINGNEYKLTNVALFGDGSVEINASLDGLEWDNALTARNNVEVVINGDINSKGFCVDASENSSVTINGDLRTTAMVTPDEEGNLEVGNMNDPDGYSDTGSAIFAWGEAIVTVNGDVTAGDSYGTYSYAGYGIEACNKSNVTVNGNVNGGNQIANPDVKHEEGNEGRAGNAIYMDSTANVKVNGNVTGGTSSGQGSNAGNGVCISLIADLGDSEEGSLYVTGIVSGNKSSAENGKNGNGIFVYLDEFLDVPDMAQYSDFLDDYEAFEYLIGDARDNLYYTVMQLAGYYGDEDWEEEHYWKILDKAYEEKTGESLWNIDSTAGSERIEVMLETMNAVEMTEDEKDAFMESLIEIYNNAVNELATIIENIEKNMLC